MSESSPHTGAVDEVQERRGHRVVVGVDFSPGARAALLFGLADAARRGVPVEAVSAYRPPDSWLDFYAVDTDVPGESHATAERRVRDFVDQVLPEGPQPAPEVRVRVAVGAPADVLIRESHGADVLVVGSRGRGGFSSMLLGSASLQCVLHASCPVTVVHSPEAHQHRLHLRRRHAEHAGSPTG